MYIDAYISHIPLESLSSLGGQPGEPSVHFDLLPSGSLVAPSGSLVVP